MLVCDAKTRSERINLFPQVQAGQSLTYQITYHSDKRIDTQSNLSVSGPNDGSKVDVSALLRLEVLGVQAQGARAAVHLRADVEILGVALQNDDTFGESNPANSQSSGRNPKLIDFTIGPDGRIDQLSGLDAMAPEQQQAWLEWADRFLLAATLPSGTLLGQKWTSEAAERSPLPLAGLRWTRESTYVRDEPCRVVYLTQQGNATASEAEPEICAVILTNATLRQTSNAKNATPEDFKLHELRTNGSAGGANRIITFISLKTGLLMRATEEASQQMNVTVAKADGSNRVHYDVNAKSRSEVTMVSEIPQKNQH
jgi:hypothetical protein